VLSIPDLQDRNHFMTVMVLTATDAVEGMSTTIGQVRDTDLTIRRHLMAENGEMFLLQAKHSVTLRWCHTVVRMGIERHLSGIVEADFG
jgi:hypothetical protein